MYGGVIAPFGIIYMLNMVVFVIVVTIVLRRKERSVKVSNQRKKMRKVFSVVILAVMFGIGWAFGILGLEDKNVLSIIFQFLFIIIVGFQGFFVFLLYPCRTKDARDLWKKWFYYATCCMCCHDEHSKSSIQRSHNLHSQKSSSTPLKSLTFTKPSSLDNPPPSMNDSTAFENPGFLPPSPDVQPGSRPTLRATALDSIKEEPMTTTNQSLLHSQQPGSSLDCDVPIPEPQ